MKKLWLVLVILLSLFFVLFLVGINLSVDIINNSIQKANYCEKDEDCKIVFFDCPFGCGSYINVREESRLKNYVKISRFLHPLQRCEYSCMRPSLPQCNNNVCTPKVCEVGKFYEASVYINGFNAIACQCPEGLVMNINESGLICLSYRLSK